MLFCGAQAAEQKVDLSNIHTVGVISDIGHTLYLDNVGLMVFSNSSETLNIDSWKMDDDIEKTVATALAPRFAVRPVSFDKDDFVKMEYGFLVGNSVPVEDRLAKVTDRDGLDAFLVVVPVSRQDPVFGTNQFFQGSGLYRRGPVGVLIAFEFYAVMLVDAHTNKIIEQVYGATGNGGLFSSSAPYVPCDISIWPQSAAQMDNAQKQATYLALKTLTDSSLPRALYALNLTTTPPGDVGPACHNIAPWDVKGPPGPAPQTP
jgi:hypothetical protein